VGLQADTKSLRQLGARLRHSHPDIDRAVKAALREEGRKVAERARQNASWSSKIPATVKVRSSGVNAVIVSAGGPAAPGAKPIEHAGAQGTFRHPVFGDRDNWVDQTARPFLHPAAIDHLAESAEAVRDALVVQVEKTIHGQDIFV
jgi:hypothetical protein